MPKTNKRKRSNKSDEIDLSLTQPKHLHGRKPQVSVAKSPAPHLLYVTLAVLVALIILGAL